MVRIMLVARLMGTHKALNADQVCHLLDLKAKKRPLQPKARSEAL